MSRRILGYMFLIIVVLGFVLIEPRLFPEARSLPISSDFQVLDFSHAAKLDSTTLMLAYATTSREEETGLSNQTSLAEDHGLLFVFSKPSLYGFWMKEMNFPIDVLWLDDSYRVTFIQKDFLPSSYPQVVAPTIPSLYVLETNAGFADTHLIHVGSKLTFPEITPPKSL